MEESADEQHNQEDGEKKDKMEGDRLKVEEMRRTAMETLGKIQKRKSEEGQRKADIKKQELDLRKQEQQQMAEAQNKQRDMFNQMLKQQQEQQKEIHDIQ